MKFQRILLSNRFLGYQFIYFKTYTGLYIGQTSHPFSLTEDLMKSCVAMLQKIKIVYPCMSWNPNLILATLISFSKL